MEHCALCKINHKAASHSYCNPCKAMKMREWRKTHPLKGEAKIKDSARHKAGMYYRRKGISKPCEVCGDPNSEKHHDDYSKPLQVRWFCRLHHLAYHKEKSP